MTDSERTELIPRNVLFDNPERLSPKVSPDGQTLAFIAPDEGVLNVWVGPIQGDQFSPVTKDRDRGIRQFYWAHDGRHLLYLQDTGGDENWLLHGVDLETNETRLFTPFDNVQTHVIDIDKRFPNEVLLGLNKDDPQLHDAYRLDLRSGELTLIAKNPGFAGWVADADFQMRAGVLLRPDGGMEVLVRDSADGDDWRQLLSVDAEDALNTSPTAFTIDGSALYAITSKDANAGRLVKIDIATGNREVIAEDPQYDVAGIRLHPDTREVQVVVFIKERSEYLILDPELEADFTAIRAAHPGDPNIESNSDDDQTWTVSFTADDGPVTYFAFDRRTKTPEFLFEARPVLSRYQLAPMEPFAFEASDGLTVHGYLTFPAGKRESLPTVLNVHGGPWARDTWGYNAEAQWLANRGYLCVQVNFRGSTGYGKAFVNAGDREWGNKMHQDLLDAVDWLVQRGFADPERIAIYGGSYGGYAALVGATFTPEVFRCAVDIVGPSNLKTLIESIPPYWAPMVAQFHQRVGNPETEEDFLWERSPLSKVENIRIPMLIAQGANDPRVKQAESEQIVDAMKQKGIDHEYLLYPDEGHGFAKPENRLSFYVEAERFLARHLGGRFEG